jgi:hypothetical protein
MSLRCAATQSSEGDSVHPTPARAETEKMPLSGDRVPIRRTPSWEQIRRNGDGIGDSLDGG